VFAKLNLLILLLFLYFDGKGEL